MATTSIGSLHLSVNHPEKVEPKVHLVEGSESVTLLLLDEQGSYVAFSGLPDTLLDMLHRIELKVREVAGR